jgi:hypothetical protein
VYGLPHEVALKVFHPGTPTESIDRELSALTAATSPHVVHLLDVTRTADGPTCLLLERCAGGSLATLLEGRDGILPGEAVTVLAPILEALTSTHRAGFTHGSLRLASVLFDAVGTPVLAGWGHGSALLDDRGRPPGPQRLAATPAVAADLGRFAAVATGVLARVDSGGTDSGGAHRLATTIGRIAAKPDIDTERRLTDALFDFAEPLPVARPASTGAPGHRVASARRNPPTAGPTAGPTAARTAGPAAAATDPRTVQDQAESHGPRPAAVRRPAGRHRDARPPKSGGIGVRVRDEVRRVRRPVWFAAIMAVVALIAAALLLSIRGGGSGSAADREVGARAVTDTPDPGRTASTAPTTPAGEGADRSDEAREHEVALQRAIAGEDPVAAASALLVLRVECLEARSESCLQGVDQPGSVALAADLAELRRRPADAAVGGTPAEPTDSGLGEPTAESPAPVPPTLVQHLGGTAIVSVPAALLGEVGPDTSPDTPSASLLMIRSEAGWRVRDVL